MGRDRRHTSPGVCSLHLHLNVLRRRNRARTVRPARRIINSIPAAATLHKRIVVDNYQKLRQDCPSDGVNRTRRFQSAGCSIAVGMAGATHPNPAAWGDRRVRFRLLETECRANACSCRWGRTPFPKC